MQIYEREGLYDKGSEMESSLLGCLQSLESTLPKHVSGARGLGALAAVDVTLSDSQWTSLHKGLNQERLLVHAYPRRGTLVLSPPLNIKAESLKDGLERFAKALTSVVL